MTSTQYQIIKETVKTSELLFQNLSCVILAQRDWAEGRLETGIHRLKKEADKIRPINQKLYNLLN